MTAEFKFRTPRFFRIIGWFGVAATPIFIFISLMAYWQEGASIGLYTLPLWLGMELFFLYYLWQWSRVVVLYAERLEVEQWGRNIHIPYAAVNQAEAKGNILKVVADNGRFRWHNHPTIQAALMAELERRVSALQAAKQARAARSFPLIIRGNHLPAFVMATGIFLLSIFAFTAVGYGLFGPVEEGILQRIIIVILFGFCGIVCLAVTIIFLKDFVWQYSFNRDQIVVRHLFQTKRYEADSITAVSVQKRMVRVKGTERPAYALHIDFSNATRLKIEPNAFSDSLQQNAAQEKQRLDELGDILRRHYLPDSTEIGRQVMAIINQISQWPPHQLEQQLEQVRDQLNQLGPTALPAIWHQAQRLTRPLPLELLITVMADQRYQPALPDFIAWLDHDSQQVRFVAAMAIDGLENGRFQLYEAIVDGWVQHDKIQGMIPAIKQWYQATTQIP